MALTIEDLETEALVAEVARLSGMTETAAVRQAMHERRERLRLRGEDPSAGTRVERLFVDEIWPALGVTAAQEPMSKARREEMLGYGPGGYSA